VDSIHVTSEILGEPRAVVGEPHHRAALEGDSVTKSALPTEQVTELGEKECSLVITGIDSKVDGRSHQSLAEVRRRGLRVGRHWAARARITSTGSGRRSLQRESRATVSEVPNRLQLCER
jgi:hypothetical protein